MDFNSIFLVIGVAVVVACLLAVIVKSKNPARYDERQKQVQAKAHKVSYYLLMILLVIYAIVDSCAKFCDTMTGVFICVCISIAVYASICIWGDAYTALGQNSTSLAISLLLVGGISLITAISNLSDGSVIENGLLTVGSLSFIAGGLCIIVGLMTLVRHLVVKNRYAAESEDE
ncbi:MAG: hypothetical protein E7546_07365 [Ruminococcaceae bacterium]|nr:hypothetical protein [Oscillospiraceae bacterium]